MCALYTDYYILEAGGIGADADPHASKASFDPGEQVLEAKMVHTCAVAGQFRRETTPTEGVLGLWRR